MDDRRRRLQHQLVVGVAFERVRVIIGIRCRGGGVFTVAPRVAAVRRGGANGIEPGGGGQGQVNGVNGAGARSR